MIAFAGSAVAIVKAAIAAATRQKRVLAEAARLIGELRWYFMLRLLFSGIRAYLRRKNGRRFRADATLNIGCARSGKTDNGAREENNRRGATDDVTASFSFGDISFVHACLIFIIVVKYWHVGCLVFSRTPASFGRVYGEVILISD